VLPVVVVVIAAASVVVAVVVVVAATFTLGFYLLAFANHNLQYLKEYRKVQLSENFSK
jgi:hypothetical protein